MYEKAALPFISVWSPWILFNWKAYVYHKNVHIGHDVTNRVPACDNFQFLNQIKILSRFFNQDLAKWGMNRNKKLAMKIKQRSCVDMLLKPANS